ncbi:hypothetical protein PENTCL1PPCAC_3888, partial [Pristionchus entomophagus]
MHSFAAVFLLIVPLLAEAKSKCQGLVWSVDEKLNLCLAKHCCKTTKDWIITFLTQRSKIILAVDMFSCGGGVEHKRMCEVNPTTGPSCPKGENCVMGAFGFGFCCDEKNEVVWHNEYAAKCPDPMKTVNISQEDVTGEDKILRGKFYRDDRMNMCLAKQCCKATKDD